MPSLSRLVSLIAGPVAFLLVRYLVQPEGMSPEANAVLASTAWVAIWWITEAIPIAATALLPIILFPLSGGQDLAPTTASFGHRLIFLYVGGFLLAIAIEKWSLHRRIALNVIRLIGVNASTIILGFMVATAALSMWISNTATAVMMLPIGMAIVAQIKLSPAADERETDRFGKALMLGIAYSASIGGMATLIGTPPNLVLAGAVQEIYGVEISFTRWMAFGLPISLVLLAICWFYLTRFAFKFGNADLPGGRAEIDQQLRKLGRLSPEESLVLAVFALTAVAWIGRSFIQQLGFFSRLDDTIIAMVAGITMFVLPSRKAGTPLLTWEDTQKLPWGIVLLFGGGMALASGFKSSGLALWIGSQMTLLDGVALFVLVVTLVAAVNFLTEITSNLATTSMLLPILAPMAMSIDVHPLLLMVSATVAASCAFMLPVATPPNAVVFGSGYLRIPDMVRVGLAMNVISIGLLSVFIYFLLPVVWQLQPNKFPSDWQPKTEQTTEPTESPAAPVPR